MDPTDSDDELVGLRVLQSGAEVASSTMVVKGGSKAKAKVFLQRSSNSSSDDVENSDENDKGRLFSETGVWKCATYDSFAACVVICQEQEHSGIGALTIWVENFHVPYHRQ